MRCDVRRGVVSRKERSLAALLLAAIAAAPLAGGVFAGAAGEPCLFKDLTGLPCATCGLTRAAHALCEGDPAAAFSLQPLGTGIALAAGFFGLGWGVVTLAGLRLRLRLAAEDGLWLRVAGGYLALVNWIYLVERGI